MRFLYPPHFNDGVAANDVAAPVLKSSTIGTFAAGTTSCVMNTPDGTTASDWLIAFTACDGATNDFTTVTGWDYVTGITDIATISVLARLHDGSSSTYTFTKTGTGEEALIVLMRYASCSGYALQSSGGSDFSNSPSFGTYDLSAEQNSRVLFGFSSTTADSAAGPPTGFTEIREVTSGGAVLSVSERTLPWHKGWVPSTTVATSFASSRAWSSVSVALQGVSPSNLSGLLGWYDASDTSAFSLYEGGTVAEWRDNSGNGRHLTSASSALAPHRNATRNGLSVVQFNSNSAVLDAVSFPSTADSTAFIVAANTRDDLSGATSVAVVLSTMNAGVNGLGIDTYNGWVDGIRRLTTEANTGTVTKYKNGSTTPLTVDLDEYFVGTVTTSGGAATSDLRLGAFLDGAYWGENYIAEVIIYNAVLGATDRKMIEGYLKQKWGIT